MEKESCEKEVMICRTCLRQIKDGWIVFSLDDTSTSTEPYTIRQKLEECIPELNLNISSNAIICQDCAIAADSAYEFKKRCLQTEECIKNYVQCNADDCVNLALVVKQVEEQLVTDIKKEDLSDSISIDEVVQFSDSDEQKPQLKVELPDLVSNVKRDNGDDSSKANSIYQCNDCEFVTTFKSQLIVHVQMHLTKSSTNNASVYAHIDRLYNSVQDQTKKPKKKIERYYKPFECKKCDFASKCKPNLIVHMRKHTGERPFKCTICGHGCKSEAELNIHIRTHTGEKPYKCSLCDYRAITSSCLKVHMRVHVPKNEVFECLMCEYKCNNGSRLKVHMRIHSNNKMYNCDHCSYSSHQKSNLKVHMMKHDRETLLKCHTCKYKTTHKYALAVHTRIHSGVKPYKCDLCEYSSIYKSSIVVHQRVHMKGKLLLFKCTECDYSASRKCYLSAHLKKHHSLNIKKIFI